MAVEKPPSQDDNRPLLLVPNSRRALAIFAGAVAGHPERNLPLIGITGTNGKTSTALLLADILAIVAGPTGLISTVGARIGNRWRPAERTTPEAPDIYQLLLQMKSEGCRSVALEVSSHALQLDRVYGLKFAAAAFTNLTQDHLDFHSDMESYFSAKAGLFKDYDIGIAAINADDPYGQRLLGMIKHPVMTYSLNSPADIQATELKFSNEGIFIRAKTPRGPLEMSSPLVGRFNAYNLLCALALIEALKLSQDAFVAGAAKFQGAPGRMQRFDLGNRWAYVDYAHTPDALKQALSQLRVLAPGPVHVLFGCGGNRDRAKRPLMGRAAEEWADKVYLTTDNPRDEDPQSIADEILAGMMRPDQAQCLLDRRAAIHKALEELPESGVLLIAGKGHEEYQEIRGIKYPFDDSQEVRRYLSPDK